MPPEGAVPRTCVPFAHVPAVPVVAVPYVPVPVPSGLPVLSVAGILPDRTGNVDVTRFLEEWAAGPLADKADKAVPLAAGNLASLGADGNLVDSGATPASIKAAAVAEVVANAPGTMDTLKEIADILGSTQQTGTVLKRILDLESGKADSSSLAAVATSGSYNDLTGKPAIPAAVTVDAALMTPGAAADAKAVGDALRSGFTPWVCDSISEGYEFVKCEWRTEDLGGEDGWHAIINHNGPILDFYLVGLDEYATSFSGGSNPTIQISRHLITPTKTSQLTNDGAPNGSGTPYATTAQVAAKQDALSAAQLANIAAVPNKANTSDVNAALAQKASGAAVLALNAGLAALKQRVGTAETALAQKASLADLPYALVTPGEWTFSGVPSNWEITGIEYSFGEGTGEWILNYSIEEETDSITTLGDEDALSLTFIYSDEVNITATRPSLPGHLLDRAVNAVSVTGATTLTLPALVNAGKSRDLLVRLTVSADAAVTFSASSGETITWDDAGSPTATYEAGTHLLRFTEVATSVFHFTDLGAGGSIDPAVLNGKLEATSAAPAFDATKTYSAGEYVTYEGGLYECTTAITTAGSWTGSTNWTARDMTTPDATLDLMADGRLRLVSADGEVLWMQGYGLESASSVTLSCDKVNFYAFASGTVTQAFDMPSAPSGKVGDFVLDVDNTANASASVTATLTGAGTAFDVFTPEGVNLSTDILTFAGGEQCELYFTMTAFGTAAKPAWKVVKQVVEKQEFGS